MSFFVSAPFAFANDYSSGDVIVNEFVTNTDAGVDQWYELLNTTGSDIDLTDWVLSSALNGEMNIGTQLGSNSKILPANGLIVISVAYNPADDAGDVLQVKAGFGSPLSCDTSSWVRFGRSATDKNNPPSYFSV